MTESSQWGDRPLRSTSRPPERRLDQPALFQPTEPAEIPERGEQQGGEDRDSDSSPPGLQEERDWSADELELLYRQALNAMEAVESDLSAASQMLSDEQDEDGESDSNAGDEAIAHSDDSPPERSPVAPPPEAGKLAGAAIDIDSEDNIPNTTTGSDPPSDGSHEDESGLRVNIADEEVGRTIGNTSVTPRQVIEAALFVGGPPLKAKKLCSLLRGEFHQEFVERCLDRLNQQYADESRPYEIRMSEGGYRLVLRPEFERVRRRVFGMGPKEIKLSQEMLEVLSLVAYKQPISRKEIEQLGKENAAGILRQLLRRELIAIERDQDSSKDVKYRATPRFLQLLGLSDFDELPQAEELSLK